MGDGYYEKKKADGLLQRPDEYLTESQLNATLRGRRHEDGRVLDVFCLPDPVEWDPEEEAAS